MTALYPANWLAYIDIFLIFLRVLGLSLAAPVFSHRAIPALVKVLFALSLALAVYPVVRHSLAPVAPTLGGLIVAALAEVAVGALMGFIASITFEAFALTAQFVGYQMGLGAVGLLDPHSEGSTSVLLPLHGWLALMIFLLADLHHGLLELFVGSFELTKAAGHGFASTPLVTLVIALTAKLFTLAVQMAAPFTFLLLACQVMLGVLARMLPQMNVILFSFPISIGTGLVGLYLFAPEMLGMMEVSLGDVAVDVMALLKAL